MSKVKAAKAVLLLVYVVVALIALALLVGVGWLLSLWYAADFLSFACIVGIAGTIGLIVGIYHAGVWATAVLDKAEEDEKLEVYMQRYNGQKPQLDYGNRYMFNLPPRGWKG